MSAPTMPNGTDGLAVSRTPEQVYAALTAAQDARLRGGEPDWNTRVVDHAERVAELWRELYDAARAAAAPRWSTAAVYFAQVGAEEHVTVMRRLLGLEVPKVPVVEAQVDTEEVAR